MIDVSQRRRGYFDIEVQTRVDRGNRDEDLPEPDFVFRGGCSLLIDPGSQRVRYVVERSILDEERLDRQRSFLLDFEGAVPPAAGGRSAAADRRDALRYT